MVIIVSPFVINNQFSGWCDVLKATTVVSIQATVCDQQQASAHSSAQGEKQFFGQLKQDHDVTDRRVAWETGLFLNIIIYLREIEISFELLTLTLQLCALAIKKNGSTSCSCPQNYNITGLMKLEGSVMVRSKIYLTVSAQLLNHNQNMLKFGL